VAPGARRRSARRRSARDLDAPRAFFRLARFRAAKRAEIVRKKRARRKFFFDVSRARVEHRFRSRDHAWSRGSARGQARVDKEKTGGKR
jgi:hypothetical protein